MSEEKPNDAVTLEIPKADPMRVVETKIDQLTDLIKSNANASLTAHEEHRAAFAELRADVDDLRGKVERGSASRPPLTLVARDAASRASTASLEVAAVEGRTLAAVSDLAAKVSVIEEKTDQQTKVLAEIASGISAITSNPMAKRVAKGLALLLLGYLASKGLHP